MIKGQETLLKERLQRLRELGGLSDFIVGSITEVRRAGQLMGGNCHLTYKNNEQKTVTRYVAKNQVAQVRRKIKKTIRVWKIISEISKINIELLKFINK